MKQCWTLLRVVSPSALILLQAAIAASAPCSGPVCLLYGRDPWKAQLNCSLALDDEQLITWTNLTGDAGSLTAVSGEGEPIEAETEAVFTVTDPSDDRVNFFRCRIGDQSQDFTVVYPIRFGKFPRSHFVTEGEDFELVCKKEVEIQRLKKIWLIVISMGSTAASVEVDNFVDGSLHQTSIRDSAFTPAHWWLYSHFVALPLGWAAVAIYDRKVPILRGPNNSMNTGLKMTILGYLATMFTIGINEMWHFWFVEEIFAVPNHWMFNMGVVVAFMGALAYVVRVYARLVELGAETPGEDPYVAEMYKMALEGKLYSRSIP
jgi:methane/ammonia monooxygenase subunit C